MSAYRVVGIDPALTNTGLVVLESDGPGDYRVTLHERVTTKAKASMLERLGQIRGAVDDFLWEMVDESGERLFEAIVIEDASAQRATRTKNRQGVRDIAVQHLAVGVVIGVAQMFLRFLPDHLTERDDLPALAFVGVEQWMPNTKTGNFKHILRKEQALSYLHCQISIPDRASEHVVMAAGVARYWIEQERWAQRIAKATA